MIKDKYGRLIEEGDYIFVNGKGFGKEEGMYIMLSDDNGNLQCYELDTVPSGQIFPNVTTIDLNKYKPEELEIVDRDKVIEWFEN